MKVSSIEFAKWCGVEHQSKKQISGVKIDSRQVQKGDVFFAFNGNNCNGEDYALSALENGASLVVVSNNFKGEHADIIKVDDVQYALQETAKNYRRQLSGVEILAITGSVGKTTTKRIVKTVLEEKYKVFSSKGNFNNEIGLPLMIFELDDSYQWAVLEMGMSDYGEIERLAEIALPKIALITNIGTAHIEFFGSRQEIAKAKLEITTYLTVEDSLILNNDDEILSAYQNNRFKIYKVGNGKEVAYRNVNLTNQGTEFELMVGDKAYPAKLALFGEHNVQNALLAVQSGLLLGLNVTEIVAALAKVNTEKMRFELIAGHSFDFINDAYNASYDSIIASVKTLCQLDYKQRCLVVGDVLESGEQSLEIHQKIGRELANYDMEMVIFVGPAMKNAYQLYPNKKYYFGDYQGVADLLKAENELIDVVLLKGSRSMSLEKIIDNYQQIESV